MQNNVQVIPLEQQVSALNEKLDSQSKTINALMDRIQSSVTTGNGAYSLFEQNTLLQQTISMRTQEVEAKNRQLQDEVSVRRQTEQALKASEGQFRALFEQAPDALFIHDRYGNVVDVNKRACEGLGYQYDELIKLNVTDFESTFSPAALDELWDTIQPGDLKKVEGTHKRKDGSTYPVEVHLSVIAPAGNKLMLAVVRDLTDRRRLEDELRQAQKMEAIGTLAGGIAHDFNNALTMVLGYGELLHPWIGRHGSEREVAYLDHMVSAARDATHVVSRLREFYRPAENNEIRVPVDLNQIASQVVSLTSPKWKGKCQAEGVQIEARTELAEIPAIAGNTAELREVLTNLVFNAVDAMPAGGSITVATREDSDGVVISVTDTGIGMTEKERERCLEPFFTTKGEHGTGLGLSVVYGIIQRHGGRIEITSAKGIGTTFAIHFPVTTMQAAAPAPELDQIDRSLRVLVVDDQDVICELLAEHLQGDHHTTEIALRGDEALELFRGNAFDLVITDQSMPGMNGVQLAAAIKNISPETPVILLTGFGDEMQAAGGLPPGVDLVLGKPVSHADLRHAIFQAVNRRPHLAHVA